ncbi:MAG: hypothetical protein WBM32_20715 [Crocosphaera sp.]|jgi:hypothetical protein
METKKAEFITLIDQGINIAENMQVKNAENQERLNNLIKVLSQIKQNVINDKLATSQGVTTLGLSREVADWVESLDSPLLTTMGQIESYYQQKY